MFNLVQKKVNLRSIDSPEEKNESKKKKIFGFHAKRKKK